MKKFEMKNPSLMGKKAWEALTAEEKERAALSWLIVLKLSTAPIRDLELCRTYLDAKGESKTACPVRRASGMLNDNASIAE